jgi:antitoxin component YwqK of YwqJK toxin-antitoxin module
MKRISFIIVFVILGLAAHSQANENLKDGYHEFKYPNGTISSSGFIKNGKAEGLWKNYSVTGILKSEGRRKNFLLDSVWVFYDQTGDTLEKINYLYGKKNGWYYKYKKDPANGLYLFNRIANGT